MAKVQIFGERRLHQRKTCAFAVTVSDKKTYYPAVMRNLSLGGALIELPEERKPKAGQLLTITIPFRLKNDTASIRGRIDRVQAGSMGVEFLRRTR